MVELQVQSSSLTYRSTRSSLRQSKFYRMPPGRRSSRRKAPRHPAEATKRANVHRDVNPSTPTNVCGGLVVNMWTTAALTRVPTRTNTHTHKQRCAHCRGLVARIFTIAFCAHQRKQGGQAHRTAAHRRQQRQPSNRGQDVGETKEGLSSGLPAAHQSNQRVVLLIDLPN